MEQSSLLGVLRDLTSDNKDLLKEHSCNYLASSAASSQVAVCLVLNGEVISRSFPLDNGHRSLIQIEEQVLMIFYPYLSRSKQLKKLRVFCIDGNNAEHVLDTDEALQNVLDARHPNSEEILLRLRVELVDADMSDIQNYHAETSEEVTEIECSICSELATGELLVKCLHCNFTHICWGCQIATNQHENHFTIQCTFLSKVNEDTKGDGDESICKDEGQLDNTTYL